MCSEIQQQDIHDKPETDGNDNLDIESETRELLEATVSDLQHELRICKSEFMVARHGMLSLTKAALNQERLQAMKMLSSLSRAHAQSERDAKKAQEMVLAEHARERNSSAEALEQAVNCIRQLKIDVMSLREEKRREKEAAIKRKVNPLNCIIEAEARAAEPEADAVFANISPPRILESSMHDVQVHGVPSSRHGCHSRPSTPPPTVDIPNEEHAWRVWPGGRQKDAGPADELVHLISPRQARDTIAPTRSCEGESDLGAEHCKRSIGLEMRRRAVDYHDNLCAESNFVKRPWNCTLFTPPVSPTLAYEVDAEVTDGCSISSARLCLSK